MSIKRYCNRLSKSGGGTTITLMSDEIQERLTDPNVQDKDFVTFVRDPIDHFLSGWSEAEFRMYEFRNEKIAYSTELFTQDKTLYDLRIKSFLNKLKDFAQQDIKTSLNALTHALPQANFMLDLNGEIDHRVKVIGDITEMAEVLEMIGFTDFDPNKKGRDATKNFVKQKYFPVHKEMLSNETLKEICEFVAVDYYLFDFKIPEVCLSSSPWMQYVHQEILQ
mmetsp:Transcript_21846/g.26760  ORF Transcript_21846/g.26760 Transcript_21846/m.26760 type:complete len:222 (+) Transcript_21846:359-1024(+)